MARVEHAYSTASQAPMLQRVWQSMRILRRFTRADLVATADAGQTAVEKFVKALHQAGYLLLHAPRVSGRAGSRDQWVLLRDSGPIAPIRRADGSGVYDPNTGTAWGKEGQVIPSQCPRPPYVRPASGAPRNLAVMHEAGVAPEDGGGP